MQYNVLAHRGWSSVAPENTMAAFRLAVSDPTVDAIECDIQLTKDGQIVVMHDFTLERTSTGKGLVKNYTYEELLQFDFGSWFSEEFKNERISLLKDLLQLVEGKKRLVIEIKSTANLYPDIAEKLLEAIDGYPKETLMIESFDHFLMKKIKEMDPELCTGLILHDDVTLLSEQVKYTQSNFVSIFFGNITQKLVDDFAVNDIEIILWTLNHEWQYDYIKQFKGSFYIASDHPGLAMKQMALNC